MARATTMTKHTRHRLAGSIHQRGGSKRSLASSGAISAISALLSVPLFLADTAAWSQGDQRFEAMQATLKSEPLPSTTRQGNDPVAALAAYLRTSSGARSPHGRDIGDSAA